MNQLNKCCIVLPIYKYELYDYEKLSFNRLIDFIITNHYENILVNICPNNFDIKKFYDDNLCDRLKTCGIPLNYISFHEHVFNSTLSYNNGICLNYGFYNLLSNEYKYMLIYQLDGYIFDDKLDYFLDLNIDYIGGYVLPLFMNHFESTSFKTIINNDNIYMNGGLSLRRIEFCKEAIANPEAQKFINGLEHVYNSYIIDEDLFFSMMYKKSINIHDILNFSYNHLNFENQYVFNEKRYPFVCHGIHKNNHLMNLVKQYNLENNLNYN